MKNICLITTKYLTENEGKWLTNELADSFADGSFQVTVIAFSWLANDPATSVNQCNNIKEIRIKLPSFFYKKNKIITLLKIIAFPLCGILYALKHVEECDLLIANTPCTTTTILPLFFKLYFKSKTFLIIWDFFPFYLKDLSVLKSRLSFNTLKKLEAYLFNSYDRVSCMTEANKIFLIENYNFKNFNKIVDLPIWSKILPAATADSFIYLDKYPIRRDSLLAVYGGAMTVVQELDNLLNLAESALSLNIHFLLIGGGSDRDRLEEKSKRMNLKNVTFMNQVSREEYNKILSHADIGLIFLSHKLSVPSFPSKSLDYFRSSLPILAGVDGFTDFKQILEQKAKAGYAFISNDKKSLCDALQSMIEDNELRVDLGRNGRMFYEEHFNVDVVRDKILKSFPFRGDQIV